MQPPPQHNKSRKRRHPKRSWPNIYKRANAGGQVSSVVDLGEISGKRIRKTFPSRADADLYAERARVERRQHGRAAFTLSDRIRHQAVECLKLLQPYGADMIEACRYYADHVLKFRNAPTTREIVKLLIEVKQHGKRREATVQELRERLGKFCDTFGDRQLSTITDEELDAWLNDASRKWSAQTKKHYMTKIGTLYRFAMRRKSPWVDRNIVEYLDRPKVENKPPQVYTPSEAANLLAKADDYGLLAYCVLGLFCGLRPRETNRLTWGAVKLSERSVVVESGEAKTRSRRVVVINDTAAAWLSTCAQKSGPILVLKKQTLLDRQIRLAKAAGLKNWKQDGLRHSFGSYLLAVCEDENKVAFQMGNSPDVVHRRYKALVTKAEAERFWGVRPIAGAVNIIPMQSTA